MWKKNHVKVHAVKKLLKNLQNQTAAMWSISSPCEVQNVDFPSPQNVDFPSPQNVDFPSPHPTGKNLIQVF